MCTRSCAPGGGEKPGRERMDLSKVVADERPSMSNKVLTIQRLTAPNIASSYGNVRSARSNCGASCSMLLSTISGWAISGWATSCRLLESIVSTIVLIEPGFSNWVSSGARRFRSLNRSDPSCKIMLNFRISAYEVSWM